MYKYPLSQSSIKILPLFIDFSPQSSRSQRFIFSFPPRAHRLSFSICPAARVMTQRDRSFMIRKTDGRGRSRERRRLESQFRCSREMWPRARISLPRCTLPRRTWGRQTTTRGAAHPPSSTLPVVGVDNEIIVKGSA